MNESNEFTSDFFNRLDLDIANYKILGSALLIYGYSEFIIASNLDKTKTYNEMAGIESSLGDPTLILVSGEAKITLGLIILNFVAYKRFWEEKLKGVTGPNLEPYNTLVQAYIVSVIANFKRLEALKQISNINASGEGFV